MTNVADVIRKLLIAHFQGDETGFRAAVQEFIGTERRLNHNTFAAELERLLNESNGHPAPRRESFTSFTVPSGMVPKDRERNAILVELTESKRSLDDLILAPSVKQALERVIRERRQADLLRSHGLKSASKILFCGPPGCGKTAAAEAMARELYLPLATVRFDAVVSSYLGETASNLRKVFDFARTRPVVLLFDEFDAIGKHRNADDEHGELKRVVNSFLQLLDGFHAETLTIAATNHQGLLDPALWRRFDDIVSFTAPTREQAQELLTRQFRQLTLDRAISLPEVVARTEGMSHADLERVAQETIKQTILEGRPRIEADALEAAIVRQHNRTEITAGRSASDEPVPKSSRRRRKS